MSMDTSSILFFKECVFFDLHVRFKNCKQNSGETMGGSHNAKFLHILKVICLVFRAP